MTLSSITADVHELQARCLLWSMPSETAAASVHLLNVGINTNISYCRLSGCTHMIFPAFIDDNSFLGSISSLVQCERHERYRTKQRHHA